MQRSKRPLLKCAGTKRNSSAISGRSSMPNTLTVADGINMVALKYPRLQTDGFAARIADEVISFIWNRYPWRVSLAELPPFYLVREIADYGPPTYAVPSDFKGLHEAWLRRST